MLQSKVRFCQIIIMNAAVVLLVFVSGCIQALENAKYSEKIANAPRPPDAIRSHADIWKIVKPATYKLQSIYNSCYPFKKPIGEIKVKFAIDAYGKIIYFEKLNSSFENTNFEEQIIATLKKLIFQDISKIKIDDVTEVVFPFRFADGMATW